MADLADLAELSRYELQRQENIARNKELLAKLGLLQVGQTV